MRKFSPHLTVYFWRFTALCSGVVWMRWGGGWRWHAEVVASTTEKGFSTSVSDGVIFAKLKDRFIQVNASLLTSADVTVNDGRFCLLARSKHEKIKLRPRNWHGKLKGCEVVMNDR